ncbi:hypothetical protein [Robinsoniella peoriensis]
MIENLQYDSFYKFIVSIGTILIVAPIIGLHYLVSGSYDIILSKQEFDGLSETSLQLINNKQKWINIVFNILPYLFIGLILIGLLCIIVGGYKWYSIQRKLDEGLTLDIQEKQFKYQKMTSSEIAEKALKDNINSQDETTKDENGNGGEPATEPYQALNHRATIIQKGFEVENAYFKFLYKNLKNKYTIRKNIKVGDAEFDIIATSKFDNIDFLYEIKYWLNPSAKSRIRELLSQAEVAGITYENIAHRNFRFKIIIVTIAENISAFEDYATKLMNEKYYNFIDIEFVDEKTILS